MDKRKALSMLGMSKKAGKLVMGFDAVKDAMGNGTAALVVLSEDLSERTAKQIDRSAQELGVPVLTCAITMDEIGQMTGRASGVIAIADKGLAGAVKNAICLEEEMD